MAPRRCGIHDRSGSHSASVLSDLEDIRILCVDLLHIGSYKGWWLTCDRLSMAGTLPAGNEDNIALCGSDVVAFQEKELINAIVLEG